MNLNKVLTLIFVFLMIILGVEGFYFINQDKTKKSILPTVAPTTNIGPSPSPEFKILYQAPNDKEGRTAVYIDEDVESHGTDYYQQQKKAIIGYFDHWELINDSQDRYLFLNNIQSKKPMLKIKIIFTNDGIIPQTRISILNLNTYKLISFDKNFSQLSETLINELITKDDSIVVAPLRINNNLQLDKQGNIIAKTLILRRFQQHLPSQ